MRRLRCRGCVARVMPGALLEFYSHHGMTDPSPRPARTAATKASRLRALSRRRSLVARVLAALAPCRSTLTSASAPRVQHEQRLIYEQLVRRHVYLPRCRLYPRRPDRSSQASAHLPEQPPHRPRRETLARRQSLPNPSPPHSLPVFPRRLCESPVTDASSSAKIAGSPPPGGRLFSSGSPASLAPASFVSSRIAIRLPLGKSVARSVTISARA